MSIAAPGVLTPQLSATISPDGRNVAFVSTDTSGEALLWIRALGSLEARPLAGTEHAAHPFWSPDGRSIGFVADGRIKHLALAGGPVQVIAESIRTGPAWGPDDTILFSPGGALTAVPASGGPTRRVIAGDESRQERVGWPRFLPDGRQFIYFFASPNAERRGIYLGSLDSTDTRLLLNSDFRAWYAPPGYLVFLRDETLMAQPFDPKRLELHGEAKPIAQGIWSARGAAQASFSVSETGVLAYVNASLWDAQLLWLDRAGRPLGAAAPAVRYEGLTPQISPDGRRVAVARGELGIQDVWILSLGGGAPERLTFTPEADGLPVWAPDSRRLMYMTRSDVGSRVFVKDVDTGEEKVLLESTPTSLFLADWSRDGSYVVFEHLQGASSDIWFARLGVESIIPTEFTATRFNETQSQLSPNGRWIAYTSNETGRDEVYVQSFPEPGRKRQVSSRGGAMPRWRADGRELYFLAGDQFLTAVPVVDQSSLELGAAQPLFLTKLIVQGSESSGLPTAYDVMPDGERFLLRYPPDNPEPPITVVLDWQAALAE